MASGPPCFGPVRRTYPSDVLMSCALPMPLPSVPARPATLEGAVLLGPLRFRPPPPLAGERRVVSLFSLSACSSLSSSAASCPRCPLGSPPHAAAWSHPSCRGQAACRRPRRPCSPPRAPAGSRPSRRAVGAYARSPRPHPPRRRPRRRPALPRRGPATSTRLRIGMRLLLPIPPDCWGASSRPPSGSGAAKSRAGTH